MATNKKESDLIPKGVKDVLDSVAKSLGVAATELWTIFVKQYFVKGLNMTFIGLVLALGAALLAKTIGLFALIPAGLSLPFFYAAIQYIGNPKYYALEDLTERIRGFKSGAKKKTTKKASYDGYYI